MRGAYTCSLAYCRPVHGYDVKYQHMYAPAVARVRHTGCMLPTPSAKASRCQCVRRPVSIGRYWSTSQPNGCPLQIRAQRCTLRHWRKLVASPTAALGHTATRYKHYSPWSTSVTSTARSHTRRYAAVPRHAASHSHGACAHEPLEPSSIIRHAIA